MRNIYFVEIRAISKKGQILIKLDECKGLVAENLHFKGIMMENYVLFNVFCNFSVENMSFISGSLNGVEPFAIISLSGCLLLRNVYFSKNLLNNYIFIQTYAAQSELRIVSALIIENSDLSLAGSFFVKFENFNNWISINDTKFILNYSPSFLHIYSANSKSTLSNVSISHNMFANFIFTNGHRLNLTVINMTFEENNNDVLLKTYSINSGFFPFSKIYGQAIIIRDYYQVLIIGLRLVNNMARNTQQGIYLSHSLSYLSNLQFKGNRPETSLALTGLLCKGNKIVHDREPIKYGNCLNLDVVGTVAIHSSLFLSNEIDVDLSKISKGATSPCIYAFSFSIELSIINSVFDNNRGFDGCHCITFVGSRLYLSSLTFSNLKGSKSNESIINQAGALSLGAMHAEITNIIIYSCSSNKAAGIYFQNFGNHKQTSVVINELLIKNNNARQSAAVEFDNSLPFGIYFFNNSIFHSNRVEYIGIIGLFFNNNINITFLRTKFHNNSGLIASAIFTIFNLGGNIFLVNSSFYNNTLVDENVFLGGSVALINGANRDTILYVLGCSLIRNFCSKQGGAFFLRTGILIVNDSVFEGNNAPIGGCIAAGYSSLLFIYSTIFKGGDNQDFPINEAAGLFINDEAKSILISCIFIKLKALSASAINFFGISTYIFIHSSIFYGNIATQGAIIHHRNILIANINQWIDCRFEQNSAENELIFIRNSLIIVYKLVTINNKGKLFAMSKVNCLISKLSTINHQCPEKLDQGCFATISMESTATFIETELKNVSSGFERDFFFVKNSFVTIFSLKYVNVTTKSEFILAYAIKSKLTLVALQIIEIESNLLFIERSFIIITLSNFSDISQKNAYKYGAIQCTYCFSFLIVLNSFNSVKTKSEGGVFYLFKGIGEQNKFQLAHNIFFMGSARSGAILFADEQNLTFIWNNATDNTVTEKGGVAVFKTADGSRIFWEFRNNYLEKNKALSGGCVHSIGKIPENIYKNIYKNNEATYGENYSSFAVRLSLENTIGNESNSSDNSNFNCDNNNCWIENVASGQFFEVVISIIDTYGQKMCMEEGIGFIELANSGEHTKKIRDGEMPSLLENSSDITFLKGVKTVKSVKGVFNFSKLVIIAKPNSKVNLVVKTDIIANFFPEYIPRGSLCDFPTVTEKYNFILFLGLRDCIQGEVYIEEENVCFPCPEGKYSLSTKERECHACPDNAFCQGRNRIIVNHGYWRSGINSTQLWKCNTISDPCLGGYESQCKKGYTSTICGSCEYKDGSDLYFKNGIFFCFPCDQLYKYMLVLAVGVAFIVLVLVVLVWIKQNESIKEGALIKLLVNHFQFISFLSNIKVTLPDVLQRFSNAQAPMTSAETFVFALDCFKYKFKIQVFAMKILLSVIITLLILFANCLVFLVIMKIKRKKFKETFANMLNAMVIIAMFLQPQFINFYMQMMSCEKFDQLYMINYLDQKCWEGEHLWYTIFIILPMLILWIFVYPGSFLFYLFKNRNNLDDKNVIKMSVCFRAGFKNKNYYWEFVIMSRNFFIIFLTNILRSQLESVILILIFAIALYCSLQVYNRPYIEREFNFLEMVSLIASFITYYSAFFYLKIISEELKQFFIIVILGVNIIFALFWIKQCILKMKLEFRNFKSLKLSIFPSRRGLKQFIPNPVFKQARVRFNNKLSNKFSNF